MAQKTGVLLPLVFSAVASALHADATPAAMDTDSYVFIGTNNEFDDFVTVNEHRAEDSHFNFGMLRFPSGQLEAADSHTLRLHLETFVDGDFLSGTLVPTDTGRATIHLVALGGPIEQYFLPNVNKRIWYNLHVHGRPILATFEFGATNGVGLGAYEVDVTEVVNSWAAAPETAYGFGLWSESGSVEILSLDGAARRGSGHGPTLLASSETSYGTWAEEMLEDVPLDLRDPDDDPDGDGKSNLREYFGNSDPDSALDCPPPPTIIVTSTTATLTWTGYRLAPDLHWKVEERQGGSWSPVPEAEVITDAASGTITVVQSARDRGIFRVVVNQAN